MDTAITFNSILGILGVLIALVAGIGAILTLIKYITDEHDKRQKWDEYDKEIKGVKDTIKENQVDTEAKLQDIKAEQCMLTYCMMATLDGLHQLGCNGKVTEARSALDKFMNKQAHGVD